MQLLCRFLNALTPARQSEFIRKHLEPLGPEFLVEKGEYKRISFTGVVSADGLFDAMFKFDPGAFEASGPHTDTTFKLATPTAADILQRAASHMKDRAAQRDTPKGERSMARCVAAFNALTGHNLSERDGWLYMVVLKAARATNTACGREDDYEDMTAYASLAGEAAAKAAQA